MFYNASNLAATGNVIVVTINYRLGVFGFYTLDTPEARGNYGLWDQIEALKWINKNIDSFGGDSQSVTIFGNSAGGFSTILLAFYPPNRGLFQRSIAQSGTAFSPYTMSIFSKEISEMISNSLGCGVDDPSSMISCIRGKTSSEVFEAYDAIPNIFASSSYFHMHIGMGPVIDGELLPDMPRTLVTDAYPEQKKFFQSIDFMTGSTNAEGVILNLLLMPVLQEGKFSLSEGIPTEIFQNIIVESFVSAHYPNNTEIWKAICDRYTDTSSMAAQGMRAVDMLGDSGFVAPAVEAVLHHSLNNKVGHTFQYEMSRDSPVPFPFPRPPWYHGCGHCDDIIYMFGLNSSPDQLIGKDIPEEDFVLSTQMMQYWTNFAKSGLVL